MKSSYIINELDKIDINKISELCANKSAVIFDMDGTLVNSEPLHHQALVNILGNKLSYSQDELYGMNDLDVYKLLKKLLQMELEEYLQLKNKKIMELLKTSKISIINSEIYTLLDSLQSKGISICLVTASEREVTDATIKSCKLDKYFKFTIARQDTNESKPSPAPYQLALKMLEIDKCEAIIFEDSPTGLESATQAQVDTVKVNWYK